MDINTVNLILWAPFGVVALLAALFYVIKGLRKGAVPTLVSLAALVVSALVSLLGARILAKLAAPGIQAMIPAEAFSESLSASGILQLMVYGILSALAAMLIFMGLFFLLTPVMGVIGKLILNSKRQPAPVSGGSRAGGAALGLVAALLYALVFLLPLYGTLAAYAPVMRTALDMLPADALTMEEPQPQIRRLGTEVRPLADTEPEVYTNQQLLRDILDCILEHPLVEISSSAPVQQMYKSLSNVSTEQAPVNFVDMADTMQVLMDKVAAYTQADEAGKAQAARELVAFLRSDVLTQDWAYSVYATAVEELPAMMEPEEDPRTRAVMEEVFALLAVNETEFRANAAVILDFAKAALEPEMLNALEQKDLAALERSGLLAQAGRLLNGTKQLAQAKQLVYRLCLESLSETKTEQLRAFAEKYPLARLTDPAQQKQEAEALCALVGLVPDVDPMRFFEKHPTLGQEALRELNQILGIVG